MANRFGYLQNLTNLLFLIRSQSNGHASRNFDLSVFFYLPEESNRSGRLESNDHHRLHRVLQADRSHLRALCIPVAFVNLRVLSCEEHLNSANSVELPEREQTGK